MVADTKPHLKIVKPSTEAQKATETTTDTIVVTPARARSWKSPSFQRELKVNEKVLEVAKSIAETEVIPGMLTLGVMDGNIYVVDGQHRLHAFILSELEEAFADVRFLHVSSEAEMADEFAKLNTPLVGMKPDDKLKAIERSHEGLQKLRKRFPWIGYANIRRGQTSPILSMSSLLRCWFASAPDVPTSGGITATKVVNDLNADETRVLSEFLEIAWKAWGRDMEHARLWLNLNLTVCMWMYRRLVITAYSSNTKKLTTEMFTKCMMSVSADSEYHDWLLGRQLRDRDRSPTYQRIKGMFARRIESETGDKPRLPSPDWGGR